MGHTKNRHTFGFHCSAETYLIIFSLCSLAAFSREKKNPEKIISTLQAIRGWSLYYCHSPVKEICLLEDEKCKTREISLEFDRKTRQVD